jgi:4-hydroxy-L-threonine phosphate dehydrogenase PdxA
MTSTLSERAAATTTMPVREQPISEQFRIVAKRWVDADAAATILEETKTSILASKMQALGEMPVSKAEMRIKASDEWREHVEKIVAARAAANVLKMQIKYLEMRHREWVSANATNRAEMGMGR